MAVFGRHNIRPPHFASKVSYSASPQTLAECSRSASCCYATTFVWILNTMHKILPANGKITDCLSKKEVFSIASSASGSAILYALYANTSYKSGGTSLRAPCLVFLICIFSSQSLYLSANALPRSIASRPAFDCVSSHVRSCLVPRSLKGIGTVARRSVQKSLSSLCGQSGLRC